MIPGVTETLNRLIELHKKKNQDYSGNRGPFFNFDFAEALAGEFTEPIDKVFATMIGIKIARIIVLSEGQEPNHESIDDSFDDLILYTTIWKAARNRNK